MSRESMARDAYDKAEQACTDIIMNHSATTEQKDKARARRYEIQQQFAQDRLTAFHTRTAMLQEHIDSLNALITDLENSAGPAAAFEHVSTVVSTIAGILQDDKNAG